MKIKQLLPAFVLALTSLLIQSNAAWAQVKIGSNHTVIGSSSNLEIEAANGKKTIVDKATGQVTIQDGTEGAGKVLTSDATGKASWVSVSQGNTFLTATGTFTCPFNGATGATGLATGITLTIPQTGWYYFESGYTLNTNGCNDYWLYLAGIGDIWKTYCAGAAPGFMVPREQNKMLYITAGTYPLLGGKSNAVTPAVCNAGNPAFYIRFIRLAL